MTKQRIEICIPDGYEFVRIGIPEFDEDYLDSDDLTGEFKLYTANNDGFIFNKIIIKKKQPEKLIFEKTEVKLGDYYITSDGVILLWDAPGKALLQTYFTLTKHD